MRSATVDLARPRRWPHLLIEEGPSCAGLERGDMIPIDMGHVLAMGTAPWVDAQQKSAPRFVLNVSAYERAYPPTRHGWRVVEDPARVEETDDATDERSWRAVADDKLALGFHDYRLRFVLDGPVLCTVRRFGPHLACRPIPRGATRMGSCASSEWRIARTDSTDSTDRSDRGGRRHRPALGGPHDVLVVEELLDGTVRWQPRSAPMGRTPRQLRDVLGRPVDAGRGDGPIERELAAGIAIQVPDTQAGDVVVGYDGIVRAQDTWRGKHKDGGERAFVFLKLTHPWRWEWENMRPDPAELAAAAKELASTEPASVDVIAMMMRETFPDAAARAAAIVEECALVSADNL